MNLLSEANIEAFLREQAEIEQGREPNDCVQSDASIVDRCFALLTRSEFRRTRIDTDSAEDLRRKLSRAVAAREAISLTVPFGGYKNHRAESFPGPDWAEVFNMNYMARYLLPLVRYYEPGVVLQYTYTSGVMGLVSNVPMSATASYMLQFRSLLSIFAAHLPENLRVTDVDISSRYEEGELLTELRRNYQDNRMHWVGKLSQIERERRVDSARRNLMRKGVVDLSSLSEREWEMRCVDAAMWCEALDSLVLRRTFNKYSRSIQLVFVRGPNLSVHVGSCDLSAHHFWSGCGILEPRKGRLRQRIVSGEKLSTFRREEIVLDVAVESMFSAVSPAFSTVGIVIVEGEGEPL